MRRQKIHIAAKIAADGAISAVCFTPPRAIDMQRETWTLTAGFATCSGCKAIVRERERAAA